MFHGTNVLKSPEEELLDFEGTVGLLYWSGGAYGPLLRMYLKMLK